MLADEKAYALILEEGDLAGLPEFAKVGAPRRPPRSAATRANTPSRWRARRSRASCSSRRGATCARRSSPAWLARGESGGTTDNRAIVAEIVKLRAERAQLLGFKSFADYRLDDQMAKTPRPARKLLDEVWGRARARAGREKDELQKLVAAEGGNFALAQWDWRYYAEKLRKARYDLDEASVKPYLALDNMIAAAFETATPAVRPDVQAGGAAALPSRTRAPGR